MSGQNPREIAARILQQREESSAPRHRPRPLHHAAPEFTEESLARELASRTLSAADHRLCQELVYGVVRWQRTLDWLIVRKTDGRRQKPFLQNLLRLGLYQLFWLDRIPDYAAVHQTIELAKRRGFGAQAGFLNAVLRGCLREAHSLRKLLAELKVDRPALGWSHPDWLWQRWTGRWGPELTGRLMERNNTPPNTFARVNTLKAAGHLAARWRAEGVEYAFIRRDWLAENLVAELTSHPPLATLSSFQAGGFYLQDPSTLLAPTMLGAQPGETVLDLCAAPGGKTTFLAQLMNNQGRIVAQDISAARLQLVRGNCRRLGVTCVECRRSPADDTSPPAKEKFDRILVDAPCSNTGVLRRRLDLRWRLQPGDIRRLQATQLDLLRQAAARLKAGGLLVYSTCSLEPEENREVVQMFLAAQTGFELDRERELLPFRDGADGAYVARLRRMA